jgi:hypothetical protein
LVFNFSSFFEARKVAARFSPPIRAQSGSASPEYSPGARARHVGATLLDSATSPSPISSLPTSPLAPNPSGATFRGQSWSPRRSSEPAVPNQRFGTKADISCRKSHRHPASPNLIPRLASPTAWRGTGGTDRSAHRKRRRTAIVRRQSDLDRSNLGRSNQRLNRIQPGTILAWISPAPVIWQSAEGDGHPKPFNCRNLPFDSPIRPIPASACAKQLLRVKIKIRPKES